MKIALINIQKSRKCVLKDMAGGFGTRFDIGSGLRARLLETAKKYIANVPDISFAYLAAALRGGGHSADYFHNSFEPGYDLYLLQSSIVECGAEREAAREITARKYGRTGVWGRFASEAPDFFLDSCDFVIRGEPEAVMFSGLPPAGFSGVFDAGYVDDIDKLPFPDWDGFPLEKYKYRIISGGGSIIPMYASRGCSYNCHYCPYKVNNPYRKRNIGRVVEEIEFNSNKHPVSGIVFRDPDFTFDVERMRNLLAAIRSKGLDRLSYYIEGRTDSIDESTVKALACSGVKSWEMGIETPRHDTLRAHNRRPPETAGQMDVISWCRKYNIRVVANYMIGFPEDTAESISDVVKFAKKINTFAVQFTVCTPYPGTKFFEEVKDSIAPGTWRDFTGWNNVYKHPRLSSAEIASMRERAYAQYHFRLAYIISFIAIMLKGMFQPPPSAEGACGENATK